ncbi:MAG: TRAM domain-containing protein [Planctomycetota bacterium]|jgi:uncharacterized protein YacL
MSGEPDKPVATEREEGEPVAPVVGPAERGGRYEPPSVIAQQERTSLKILMSVLRSTFLVLLVTVTLLVVLRKGDPRNPTPLGFGTVIVVFLAVTAFGVLVLFLDLLTPNKRLTSVVGIYLGLVAGLIGAIAIGALLDVVAEAWELNTGQMAIYIGLAKVVIAITLCYLAISLVLTTKDNFRLVIPYVEFARQVRGVRPLVLDTSALIDGRIESFGGTGFLDAPLIVPQFVIDEMQTLSDSGDRLKRTRGRRGLTVVRSLQQSPLLDVSIDDTVVPGHSVDHMLISLAEEQNLRILTTDYNLNKVAQIRGVTVLNLNDLANTLKSQAVPGETLVVDVVKTGESPGQGVGYMPDGTMVVIEEAAERIGDSVATVVTNSLQTSAGRMIFGRLATSPEEEAAERGQESATKMGRAATSQPRTAEKPSRQPTTSPRNPRR